MYALNNIYRKLKDLRLNVYRQLKRFILKKKPEDKKIEDLNNPNSLQNLSKELGKAGPEIAGFTTKFGMIGLSNVYTQFNNVKEHGISAIYNNLENGSNPYKVEYGYNNKENGSPSIEIVMEPAEFTELKTFVAKNVKQTLSLIKAARRYKGLTSTEQYVVKSALLKLEFDDSFEVVDNLVDISSEELGQFLQHKYTNLNSKLNPALKEDIVILDDVKAAVQEFVTSNSSFKSINNNSKKSLTYTSHSSRLS